MALGQAAGGGECALEVLVALIVADHIIRLEGAAGGCLDDPANNLMPATVGPDRRPPLAAGHHDILPADREMQNLDEELPGGGLDRPAVVQGWGLDLGLEQPHRLGVGLRGLALVHIHINGHWALSFCILAFRFAESFAFGSWSSAIRRFRRYFWLVPLNDGFT